MFHFDKKDTQIIKKGKVMIERTGDCFITKNKLYFNDGLGDEKGQ